MRHVFHEKHICFTSKEVYKCAWLFVYIGHTNSLTDIQHLRKVLLLSGRFTADSSFSSSGFAHFQKFTYFTCIVNVS